MSGLLLAAALLGADPVACAPGVYLEAADGALTPLAATAADRRKVAGLGGAMFLGGRLKVKTVIPGARAATRVHAARPRFRFCFTVTAAVAGSDYVGATASSSPADYRLVRLEAGGSERELLLSRAGGFGGTAGAVSESAVRVRAVEMGPGQFRVELSADLAPGEYGFLTGVAKAASARKKDVTEQVFDFGVD